MLDRLRRLIAGCVPLLGLVLSSCGGGGETASGTLKKPLAAGSEISPEQRDDLYRFFAVAFNAAPGTVYMGQLLEAANAGLSTKEIVNIFTTKSQFLATYPESLTAQAFAQKLVENVVGASASSAAKSEAAASIAAALSPPFNWTRGDVVYVSFSNLAGKPANDPQWASAAQQLRNQVSYAKFYTETMKGSATDLESLRAVVATVTAASESTSQIERNIQAALDLKTPVGVAVAIHEKRTVGSQTFGSSSRLQVSWQLPSGTLPARYLVTAQDSAGRLAASTEVSGSATSVTLSDLKAASAYAVSVKSCADSACALARTATPVQGTTSSEYWQLQGNGNTTAGLTRIVSDGNVRISATRIGPEAGGPTANRIQLYYGAAGINPQALTTAITSSPTSAASKDSYLSFISSRGTTGLGTASPASTLVGIVATGQGIPLSVAMGGKTRLFFEATGADNKTRIFWIDSVDGYVGQDFNSGSSTFCSSAADYSAGGCVPQVAIGVEGDTLQPTKRLSNVRQHKVGYPTLKDWRWDGAVGTFMVFTFDKTQGCATGFANHGYAVWDGKAWQVQYAANGCPKAFESAQAAFPLHLGGVRYKMYYGDPSVTTGRLAGGLPFLGPKRLIYADGTFTGSPTVVDFEDWEPQSAARDVIFLWPNGDKLDDTAEGYIDDYHFLMPTASLDLQVMYLAITNGTEIPFSAAAILLNP